ncbi:MAG: hypothetical protein PF795_01180, partial [Kiritimatiellae bacterium]|nr:hypothetical protein [Kiritimatiellia bacterium]
NTASQTGLTGYDKTSGSGSDHHMHFSHSNLVVSCVAENSYFSASHRRRWGGVPHGLSAAQGVFWNARGEGERYPYVVESKQGRYGYVIGTQGAVTAVNTELSNEYDITTRPEDHTEGIGQGENLIPPSIYRDQLLRRLGGN